VRKEAVGNKTRYVNAWFDDELTKLEGAEKLTGPPDTSCASLHDRGTDVVP
jgi:hypothetical protein